MIEVSTRELKANLSRYLREVEQGAELVVTRRGKRIATISGSGTPPVDEAMARLLASGMVQWNGKKFQPPARGARMSPDGPSIQEIVAWGRR